ncbi:MAG: ABC transporter substrate-binding protein [Dehalococcoidales bacterium]
MKSKLIVGALGSLIVVSLLLASCANTTSSTTATTASVTTVTNTTTTTSTTIPPSTTSTSSTTTAATVAATTTSTGNWWDSLGTPQYGGTLTLQSAADIVNFDPYEPGNLNGIYSAWLEPLNTDDWTVSPSVFSFNIGYHPAQFQVGDLASSWEFTDTNTFVVHLRQGIYWQNLPPANGREFIASDVVDHYQRLGGYGTFTADPLSDTTQNVDLVSVTATDNFTVVFKTKTPNPEATMENLLRMTCTQSIENPDAVAAYTNASNPAIINWHNCIGTGPFILTDFVDNTAATLTKNPNYWGYDERYPQNQLPYVNSVIYLIIPNQNTALAALRTGKIDCVQSLSMTAAQGIIQTNPELVEFSTILGACETLEPRNDLAPYNDIRVREALQMALNLPEIANSFYQGTAQPYPQSLASSYMVGWSWPYQQWPAALQAQYAYNPTAAKQLLAQAGFPNGFNTDVVADDSGNMDLLQIIQSEFAAIGVNMTIQPMDPASWTSYVVVGKKQDALAYRSGAGTLGNINTPIKMLQRDMNGFAGNFSHVNDPVFNAFYPAAMASNTIDQVNQIVMQANQYVAEQHFAISIVQPNTFGFTQPWFKGYTGQFGAEAAGGNYLCFYLARFWVNAH